MSERVNVIINGKMFALMSDESPLYLQELGHYVSQKTDEVMAQFAGITPNEQTLGIIIALNIADELFKEKPARAQIQADHEKFILEMGKMHAENAALREVINNMQREMERDKIVRLSFTEPEPRKAVI